MLDMILDRTMVQNGVQPKRLRRCATKGTPQLLGDGCHL
jgi:hypothetical protein